MNFEEDTPVIIEEKRLVGTMITGKPDGFSLIVMLATVLTMGLTSQFYWGDYLGWAEFLPAVNKKVFVDGEVWRIFTAVFIHSDFAHFLSNMYMLSFFSFFIFAYFGFSIYPLISVLLSGLVNALAIITYAPDVRLLGASGLVYLLGGFWLTVYFFIQRQHKIFKRLLRVTGIAIMVFWPSTFVPTTSYRTHAIGFFVGIAMGIFYFYKNRRKIRAREVYKVSYVETDPTAH